MSDAFEQLLSRVCSTATSKAMECLSPRECELVHPDRGPPSLVAAYQYPRKIPERPMVSSHQVVIRGPAILNGCSSSYQSCLHAVSDLHTDSMDGQMGCLGAMTQYICLQKGDAQCGNECPGIEYRDLVVFPRRDGGRGARVRVACPGWTTLVFMQTRERLHGGVVPSSDYTPATLTLGDRVGLLRIVTYPLAPVQRLLGRALSAEGAVISEIERRSDTRMRRRMSDWM